MFQICVPSASREAADWTEDADGAAGKSASREFNSTRAPLTTDSC